MNPWEIVPAFSRDRFTVLAQILLRIRARAAALQESGEGDSAWSLGCRVHSRTAFQITRIAASQEFPWLTAHLLQNSFYLSVGGIPIHIFRGDSEDPDGRQLERGREKAQAQLEMLETQQASDGWSNYLVVETAGAGNGLRVVFFQANELGETRYDWTVPTEESLTVMTQVASIVREGRELPAPVVAPRLPSTMRGNDDTERDF